jgi:DHA1 family tetracycline resistance protein-like MFS transporter
MRAASFGMIGGAFGLGFVLGPALGGFLGELGPRAPFFTAAGLAGLNFIYGFFVLPESLPESKRRPFDISRANPLGTLRAFRGHSAVLGLALAAFFWQLAFHVYPSTWSYYAIAKFQLTPAAIGGTLAVSGVSLTVVQGGLTGRIVRRIGEPRAALLGVAWGGTVFLAYALIPQQWMLYPLLLVGGLQGIANPSINALMSRELGPERQGELQGGMASVMGLSSIVGPLALTQTLAQFSGERAVKNGYYFPGAAFALAAALAGVCFVILLSKLRAHAARPTAAVAEAGSESRS